jgi:hypothetical protein
MFYAKDWKPKERRNFEIGLSRIRDEWWLDQPKIPQHQSGTATFRWFFTPLNYCGDLLSPFVKVFTDQYFDIR